MKTQSRGQSFQSALSGLVTVAQHETNFQIHLILATLSVLLAFFLKISVLEFLFIIVSISLVLTLELINTAIEHSVDLATMQYNETAKLSKDIAAAAVLIASLSALVVGFVIFYPKIIIYLETV